MATKPEKTVHYEWREFVTPEGEDKPRLMIPRCDPHQYEFAFDFGFETPEDACTALVEHEIDEAESKDWLLVKVTTEPYDLPFGT